jgi:biotin carboxylase
MCLGASKAQLDCIKKAKEMGIFVITCDYDKKAIGHAFSDASVYISTFDYKNVMVAGKSYAIDGIMTMGTDQPVYTAAYVAEHLGLPTMISEETAFSVTNKIRMKQIFMESKIPTVDYRIYEKGIHEDDLDDLIYPVVVKPIDSQGQRGIYYLESKHAVIDHYEKVVQHSRDSRILVETYYEHDEITVSGWVYNNHLTVLSITDRVTFKDKDRIGICLSHELPSKHMFTHGDKILELSIQIVTAFNIHNGPIYFQLMLGAKGLYVNEIACRIGGAYEGSFIPHITGFDIVKVQIEQSLNQDKMDTKHLKYQVLMNKAFLSVQLFFCKPCIIHYMPSEKEIMELEGVFEVGFNFKSGDQVYQIENATARIGYVIVEGASKEELEKNLIKLYEQLTILDENGMNQIIHRKLKGC